MQQIPEKFRQVAITVPEIIRNTANTMPFVLFVKSGTKKYVSIDQHVQDQYDHWNLLGFLPIAFIEFKERVLRKINKHYPRYRGWDRTGGTYRNGPKYRKNLDHLPKENDSVWREYKQFRRDKSKHKGWHCRPDDGIKPWKVHSARQHRRWARQNIHHQQYDVFGSHEYKMFVDSYDYD